MRVRAIITAILLSAQAALAQGFAGLGQGAEGFTNPTPNPTFRFPADHGAHPDYRIEWWYLTATLQGADGRDYGIQWTLFRSALAPNGVQVWMGHAGLTTPEAHFTGERFARGGVGQAGVTVDPFEAWIDDWSMQSLGGADALDALRLTARAGDSRFDLNLTAQGPLVFHGADGYSIKSDSGQASYYYSQPYYTVTGTLELPEGPVEVTGAGWLDREWSSQPLDEGQEGWDWFSLHFEDGARLMAFGLRGTSVFTYASWILPDGTLRPTNDLRLTPLARSQVAGREVPTQWRVEVPGEGVDVEVTALNPNAWQDTVFPYWEGPVRAKGSHTGVGYLEMTGYE